MIQFEIKYETASDIPPPYCYYYHIHGQVTRRGLETDFAWVYHNREELSQEEIEEEGFTGQDDFSWKGVISAAWQQPLEKLLKATRFTANTDEQAAFLEVDFRTKEGKTLRGTPVNLPEWEYFLQELVQCIYETAGKEAPLLIRYKKVTPETTLFCSIKMQFAERKVSLQMRKGTDAMRRKEENWETMKQVLEQIYSLDFQPEAAEKREPSHEGLYIDAGEDTWYDLKKAATSAQKQTIAQIERFFDRVIETR